MKRQWLIYPIVAILAIGVGIAIAGLPNDVPVDATISTPTTTDAPEATLTPTTTLAPESEDASSPPESTTTTVVTTTATFVATTIPLLDRSELVVATANGTGRPGSAARVADSLEAIGYVNVMGHDGGEVVEFTIVYYADGFQVAAARLAGDLDLLPDFIAPIADAPPVQGVGPVQLIAYVGADRG